VGGAGQDVRLPGAVRAGSSRTQQQSRASLVFAEGQGEVAIAGELRTAGGGRPNHSVAPGPAQSRKEWSLDFSGWLSVQFPGIVIAVCTREKNLKLFFTLQTLDENGVEAENQPSRTA
jgi:hypothetical protein